MKEVYICVEVSLPDDYDPDSVCRKIDDLLIENGFDVDCVSVEKDYESSL